MVLQTGELEYEMDNTQVQQSKTSCFFVFFVNLECGIFNLFRWFQKHWKKEYFPDRFDVTELFFACYQYMNTTNKVESANIWIIMNTIKSHEINLTGSIHILVACKDQFCNIKSIRKVLIIPMLLKSLKKIEYFAF